MSDQVVISLIGSMVSLFSAAIAGYVAIKIAALGKSIDGMKTELVAATERGASAEGQIQGRKEATAEAVDTATVVAKVAVASQDAAVAQAEINATAAEKQQAAAIVQQAAAETQKAAAETVSQKVDEVQAQSVGEVPGGSVEPKTTDAPGG